LIAVREGRRRKKSAFEREREREKQGKEEKRAAKV
jgi:hypothetical protein